MIRCPFSRREVLARLSRSAPAIIGPVRPVGVLVARHSAIEAAGELFPVRVLTIEAAPLPDGPDGRRLPLP